jgi:Zn ribbon nucleic-acid-binding protein
MQKDEKVRRIGYKCVGCGHEDTLKWWTDDPQLPPPMINCANCGDGRGLDLQNMLQHMKGMAQKQPVSLVTH